jgi:hypothetical protein
LKTESTLQLTKGLVIASPWISLILSGQKDWEMRGRGTDHRGWFALIWKGMGEVYGVAKLVDVHPSLNEEEMVAHFDRHRIPEEAIRAGEVAGWTTPWVLSDVIRLPRPVRYKHPSGAVTWVKLEDHVIQAIEQQVDLLSSPPTQPARAHSLPLDVAEATSSVKHLGESQITQGNIDNNHFYLRSFIERFPPDLVGGSNKRELASRMATVHWNGGDPITTDIDGSKKFFRSRGWIGDFFRLNKVAAGDKVVIDELAPYQYRVTHRKVG